jgi:uncharacterized protein
LNISGGVPLGYGLFRKPPQDYAKDALKILPPAELCVGWVERQRHPCCPWTLGFTLFHPSYIIFFVTVPNPATAALNPEAQHLQSARASLAATIANYQQCLTAAIARPDARSLQALLEKELAQLATTLDKLDRRIVRIAVFGLVSRGKSAVLNALVGETLLTTGPLNGVTQQVQVVQWVPPQADGDAATIELLDTPGLDEVDGATRAVMAAEVAALADLILFVVAGEITQVEYAALCQLRSVQKPLMLVFNKIDLYPEQTRDQITQNLVALSQQSIGDQPPPTLVEDEIVLIAADPTPQQVRVERPGGAIEYLWEKPPAQIAPLQQKILTLLRQEGRSLLALNALMQSQRAEQVMSSAIIDNRQVEAEALIWRFVRYKAIGVGLNPFGFLDFIGGAIADLTLIRALAKLYGLPMTRYEAGSLLQTILFSSGGLLVTELLGGLVLGFGKGLSFLADGGSLAAFTGIGGVQAAAAGYGAYAVGRSAQVYLEQGCSWGTQGANTVIQSILGQVDPTGVIDRLYTENNGYANSGQSNTVISGTEPSLARIDEPPNPLET